MIAHKKNNIMMMMMTMRLLMMMMMMMTIMMWKLVAYYMDYTVYAPRTLVAVTALVSIELCLVGEPSPTLPVMIKSFTFQEGGIVVTNNCGSKV
jgi:hypothetical protein